MLSMLKVLKAYAQLLWHCILTEPAVSSTRTPKPLPLSYTIAPNSTATHAFNNGIINTNQESLLPPGQQLVTEIIFTIITVC